MDVLDSDALPTLSINDVAAAENGGKDAFVFTVTLSPAAQTVTVQYTTVTARQPPAATTRPRAAR